MKTHRLKLNVSLYNDVKYLRKSHEYRFNDREFELDDQVHLAAVGDNGKYLSEIDYPPLKRFITNISYGPDYEIPNGFCVFSVTPVLPKCWQDFDV